MNNKDIYEWLLDEGIDPSTTVTTGKGEYFLTDVLERHLIEQLGRCDSKTSDIIEKIEFYKSEEERYRQLCKEYPNDFDFKREVYGYASRIFTLEWVLSLK